MPLGEALAAAYARVLPDLRFEVVETPGSVVNLRRVQGGDAELAFSIANILYSAYGGLDAEFRPALNNLRTIAVLHPSTVHVLVPASSTARTVADLQGRVAVGQAATALTAKGLITGFGRPTRVVVDQTMPLTEAAAALETGEVEGVVVVAAAPVDLVSRAIAKGARLLPIPAQDLRRLRDEYPFLRPGAIAPGVYPGVEQPVATLLVDVLLVTRADLDDELVRRLTAALFDALPELASKFEYFRLMNVQRAPATPVPLHPGALLFYRERELSR